jgi:ubiquinone/menaquinone biosynthesis C-methylase UbiE
VQFEGTRLEVAHQLVYNVVLGGRLHDTHIRFWDQDNKPNNFRVLDVGCGTSIWALSMANNYPAAQVMAIDLVEPLPAPAIRNYHRKWPVDFNEPHWHGLEEASFDFIHLAFLCGSVANWETMLQTACR